MKMKELKLIVYNTSKERTDFNAIGDVPVIPAITTLLHQYKAITKIYKDIHETFGEDEDYESSLSWQRVDEEFNAPLYVFSLEYRFDAEEDYTEDEGDAVNDLIQLVLCGGVEVFHASAILSNMQHWNAEHLLNWINTKDKTLGKALI